MTRLTLPNEGQLLRQLVELVRTDSRVRLRHVRVEWDQLARLIEIGGTRPPWWRHVVNLKEAASDPRGYARRVVDSWTEKNGETGLEERVS